MNPDTHTLKQLTETLLTQDGHNTLREAAQALYTLCCQLTGIQNESLEPEDCNETKLPSGLALSPTGAALCAIQYPRTAKFLRGLAQAIRVAQERFPGQPIQVLYAGCGPFATLAVPLMTQFRPDEVQFTLLDIHARSLTAAQELIEHFGLADFVAGYVQADATVYVHPQEPPLHIVVTETMQRALMKEPQVAVTLNLVPQLCPGGLLVPEEITVDACLYRPSTEFAVYPAEDERVRVLLARLLTLNAAQVPDFAPVTFTLPEATTPRLRLMLRTIVQVFGDIVLGEYESGITCPYIGKDLDAIPFESQATLQYIQGAVPGFRVEDFSSLADEPQT